jgi:hypothetical protein
MEEVMRIFASTAVLLMLAGCVGCESNAPTTAATQSIEAAPPPPQPAAPAENAAPAQAAAPAAQQPVAVQPGATAPADQAAASDPTNAETAQAGVGKRGRDYEPGFVTTPIAEYFTTGDRIAFEVQIPSAMKLYKAAHDNKGPKTHEEYFNVIIKENAVQLPDLPAGDSYIYDPKAEELMVRHPKPKEQ